MTVKGDAIGGSNHNTVETIVEIKPTHDKTKHYEIACTESDDRKDSQS